MRVKQANDETNANTVRDVMGVVAEYLSLQKLLGGVLYIQKPRMSALVAMEPKADQGCKGDRRLWGWVVHGVCSLFVKLYNTP